MADPADIQDKGSTPADESFVIDPIKIARARHASTATPSVADKTRRVTALAPPSKSGPQPSLLTSVLGAGNCLLLSLLGLVFLVGGLVGGMVGGGMVLWVNSAQDVALARPASPTSIPSPTPAPAETVTPTPTPLPVATLAIEDIIAQAIPSVVTVLNQHHGLALGEEGRVAGSGVIIDSRGYIATNHHVVENPGDLSVILADGREVPARLVASEPQKDLAVVSVAIKDLPAIIWGDSATVRPGQDVYAIGSPLGDFPNSVSFGIVSGLNRALEINEVVIDGLIQTDAAINRGSSGGPLLSSKGEMIGINTFIIRESENRGVTEGIAFAIPTNAAKNLLLPWIAADLGEPVPIPVSGEPPN